MAKILEIRDLVPFILATKDVTRRAFQRAILRATLLAEMQAKKNAARNFPGTVFRAKTGNLLNAIFSGFEADGNSREIKGFVGVRAKKGRSGTRPYGRIHEFGGEIRPVRAKWLWIPIRNAKTRGFENMTPRDFVQRMNEPGGEFKILDGRSSDGKVAVRDQAARFNRSGKVSDLTVLFALRKQVKIPARPYVRPAVRDASKKIPEFFSQELRKESGK